MFKYKLKGGVYYLFNEKNEICYACDQVSFAYDAESFTLLKHGSFHDMSKYLDRCAKKGLGHVGIDIDIVIVNKDVPIDEINHVLDCVGYLRQFIEKWGNQELSKKSDET